MSLLRECEAHDSAPFRSSYDEVVELFEPGVLHLAMGAFDDLGDLVAFGIVRALSHGSVVDARCSGAVHPRVRDRQIGSAIVEWQIGGARELLATINTTGGARISHFCSESATEEAEILERTGFRPHSWFTQMRRNLSIEIPTPEMAGHLRIEPWKSEWSEMILDASAEPEALTEAGRGLTEDEWERMHANLVPEWSAVVIDRSNDRSRVAGYVMAARWEDDWAALGWTEGYINALGIFSPWRKQRVGQGLLSQTMRKMRSDGMQFAGIDIGSEDLGGMDDLSATMGFEFTHRTILYVIEVAEPA
ncbi:MAG: hypothetical protein L0G23_00765 [Ruaniaceae bacterium]|nr:hypothetical protein [Ruaniaceae bacterium]